jgi:hypothetical protein
VSVTVTVSLSNDGHWLDLEGRQYAVLRHLSLPNASTYMDCVHAKAALSPLTTCAVAIVALQRRLPRHLLLAGATQWHRPLHKLALTTHSKCVHCSTLQKGLAHLLFQTAFFFHAQSFVQMPVAAGHHPCAQAQC